MSSQTSHLNKGKGEFRVDKASNCNQWQVIKSEIVFANRLTVVCDELLKPDGGQMQYRYFASKGSASVLAFTEQNQVVLTQQYRHPLKQRILDLPAGGINEGETPQVAALRELMEETGYTATTIEKLGHYAPLPGLSSHVCHVFVARGLRLGATNLDEHEIVEVVLKDWRDVVKMVINNEVLDGSLTYAVLKFLAATTNVEV